MGIPWKKIGAGILKGITIGAAFDPRIAAVSRIIMKVEDAWPNTPGASKLAAVEDISDAILEDALLKLSPEKQSALKAARKAYIDSVVALNNAAAKTQEAAEAFKKSLDGG